MLKIHKSSDSHFAVSFTSEYTCKSRIVRGELWPAKLPMLKSSPPVFQNVITFGNNAFKVVIMLKQGQSDGSYPILQVSL